MEAWLIPTKPSHLPPAERVLVLAPHPDDEIFGCGGTIGLYSASGANVLVIVCTDGAGYQEKSRRQITLQLRSEETNAALAILGVAPAKFVGWPDRQLATMPDLVLRIKSWVQEYRPNVVFVPAPTEIHPDHRALSRSAVAAMQSIEASNSPLLLGYEIGFPLWPDKLIDISEIWEKKKSAMGEFKSQLTGQNYLRHMEGLNAFRTYSLPRDVGFAEAFCCLHPTERNAGLTSSMPNWDSILNAATVTVENMQRQIVWLNEELLVTKMLLNRGERSDDKSISAGNENKLNELIQAREDLESEIFRMKNSLSWKLTAPLRSLRSLLLKGLG